MTLAAYQSVMLEHNRNPQCAHPIDDATHRASGKNPLCGERFNIEMRLHNDVIDAIGFTGDLSAVSTACASIMCGRVLHRSLADALDLAEAAFSFLLDPLTEEQLDQLESKLGEFAVFRALRAHPNRLKVATLPWVSLRAALLAEATEVSTDANPRGLPLG